MATASIAVEPTPGAPKLTPPADANTPPPRDDQAPPPPAAGAPQTAPPETTIVQLWTPEEAAAAVTGAHNMGGAVALMREPEAMKAWYANPNELDGGAGALARLFDRLGVSPGGAGAGGLFFDLMIAGQSVVDLEVRHIAAVMGARKRVERRAEEHAAAQRAPEAPPMMGAVDQSTPAAPVPATPPPSGTRKRGGGGPFRFGADQLQVLDVMPLGRGDHHGSMRSPEAV